MFNEKISQQISINKQIYSEVCDFLAQTLTVKIGNQALLVVRQENLDSEARTRESIRLSSIEEYLQKKIDYLHDNLNSSQFQLIVEQFYMVNQLFRVVSRHKSFRNLSNSNQYVIFILNEIRFCQQYYLIHQKQVNINLISEICRRRRKELFSRDTKSPKQLQKFLDQMNETNRLQQKIEFNEINFYQIINGYTYGIKRSQFCLQLVIEQLYIMQIQSLLHF